jgi:excinuclease ABC subunit B
MAYNEAHHITPQGVQKAVRAILEEEHPVEAKGQVAETAAAYTVLSPMNLSKKINQLEKIMYQHAENLEFERAAQVRDEIQRLREGYIG